MRPWSGTRRQHCWEQCMQELKVNTCSSEGLARRYWAHQRKEESRHLRDAKHWQEHTLHFSFRPEHQTSNFSHISVVTLKQHCVEIRQRLLLFFSPLSLRLYRLLSLVTLPAFLAPVLAWHQLYFPISIPNHRSENLKTRTLSMRKLSKIDSGALRRKF